MEQLRQNGSTIVYQTFGERLILSPYEKNCIRLRSSPNADIREERWTLLDPEPAEVEITVEGQRATMRNGDLIACIDNGWVSYRRTTGELLLSDGKTHAGGHTVRCVAELADSIAFVREGCDVIGAFRRP